MLEVNRKLLQDIIDQSNSIPELNVDNYTHDELEMSMQLLTDMHLLIEIVLSTEKGNE